MSQIISKVVKIFITVCTIPVLGTVISDSLPAHSGEGYGTAGKEFKKNMFSAVPQPDSLEILIVGGGMHHDFARWFGEEDLELFSQTGASVRYTEDPGEVPADLPGLDILYLSNNQPLPDATLREEIFEFVESGKGLLLVHPALWYNWEDWPAYNRDLAGGGSRSHPPYGEFEVRVTDPDHPVMTGVPEAFTLADELYRFEADPEGSDMHVLAVGVEEETGEEYPVAWAIEYGKGRIVCITLGHDGASHEHEAYRKMLRNSMDWLTEND